MKKIIDLSLLSAFFLLASGFAARAGILPTSSSIYTPVGGTAVVIGQPEAYTTVDFEAPSGGSHTDRFKKGILTFGVNHHYPVHFSSMRISVQLEVKTRVTLLSPDVTDTITMEISYSPEDSLSFTDKQSIVFDNIERYSIEIIGIDVNGSPQTTLPANLYLNTELFVDRYYDFSSAATSAVDIIATGEIDGDNLIDSDCDGNYDELELTWDPLESAEEYQLEWVYVNDYDPAGGFYDDSELSYDFKRNSTRIATTSPSYRISLAYDRGYICYRVRAIGRATSDLTQRIFGVWSEADEQGTVDGVNYYFKDYSWHDTLNWQFSATYAEEGKKKEVISFYDGSLRNRQMVTRINSDDNTIVGETIYDHQGRPAIQVLPTPVQDLDCEDPDAATSLRYYHNFTQNAAGDPYTRADFDVSDTVLAPCALAAQPMGTGNGAARYYSPDNPDQSDENAFIPDAELYPFSQVEYTPDNTGRVRRQGGVGEDFQLGSGHESRFYYGHPSQLELDRMFGSEAGDYLHYQKNMVVDPNGQISVSYLDQEGRVIATSLAGDAPANLLALPSEDGAEATLTDDLFARDGNGNSTSNQLSDNGAALNFNETILVAGTTEMTFDYDLEADPFTDACLAEGICFSCVYDLTIRVIDECGTDLVAAADTIIPTKAGKFFIDPETTALTFETDCDEITAYDFPAQDFTLTLPTGSYQVVKTLTINDSARQYYAQAYLDSNLNTCIKTLWDFEQEYLANTDFSDCDQETNCDSCLAHLGTLDDFTALGGTAEEYTYRMQACNRLCEDISPCDVARGMLLGDLSPGGQYAQFVAPDGTTVPEQYPLSILNPDNILPYSIGTSQIDWHDPRLIIDGSPVAEYRDEDGSTRSRVEVVATVSNTGTVTASVPEVDTPGTHVFQDASTGEYYTYPEYLVNTDDFIAAWQSSWANSLLAYHPEYAFYKMCLEYDVPVDPDDAYTSDSFDSLLRITDTWNGAIAKGFIKSNYATFTDVNDRLTNWFSASNAVWDPFVVQLAAFDNYGTELFGKFSVYATLGGNDYSMAQLAANGARCPNTMGALPDVSCFRFGDDVTLDTDYNDSIRDREWQILRAFYLSTKQEQQQQLAISRSIHDVSYIGYNGCIGTDHFNPLDHGFFDNGIAALSTEYFNVHQPCFISTYTYYKDKVKRFPDLVTDQSAAMNEGAYQNYLLTGQCPAALTLQQLLSEAAARDTLTDDDFLVSPFSAFNGFYLALNNNYLGAPVPVFSWEQTTFTSSQLIFQVIDTTTTDTLGTVQLDIPSGLPAFNWTDILGFSNLTVTGGTYAFEVKALVDTTGGTMIVTLTGETTFRIGDCRFDEVCTLNQTGTDLSVLMDALAAGGDLDATSSVQILGGGSSYAPLATGAIQTAAYGGPVDTLYWSYDNSLTTFELYSPTTDSWMIDILGTEPAFNLSNLNLIGGITDIVPTGSNSADIICEDGTGTYLVTLHCSSSRSIFHFQTGIPLGDCDLPTSILCDGPAFHNTNELYILLADVLSSQQTDPGYDLFSSYGMTAGLALYFPYETDTTFSTTDSTVVGGIHYETTVITTGIDNCPITLTISDSMNPVLSLDDISALSEDGPILSGEPDADGQYHAFYFVASFTVGDTIVADTVFVTTCIPLNICAPCPDSIPILVDTSDIEAMEMMMELELGMGYFYEDLTPDYYSHYAAAVDSLNARMGWEPGDSLFVEKAGYDAYFQEAMRLFADTYDRFIDQFDPELDDHAYLDDPLLFVADYGYYTNVSLEYERYLAAVARYNAAAVPLSLDTLAAADKAEFAYTHIADELNDYVLYLQSSIADSTGADDIETFQNGGGGMFLLLEEEEDTCETLYDSYVDAYLHFESVQDTLNFCPDYLSNAPLLSLSEFEDHNLCCTELGQQVIADYIALLLSDTLCPGALPSFTDCEDPGISDTTDCHKFWVNIKTKINQYNASDWAIAHNSTLDPIPPYFSLFQAEGYCSCALDYFGYLGTYIGMDSDDVAPFPLTLEGFCHPDTTLAIPDSPCETAYTQYLDCISRYNRIRPESITSIVSYPVFLEMELCGCVDLYCSKLDDAIENITSPKFISALSLIDLCNDNTAPPCAVDGPATTIVEFPVEPFSDPCTDMLTSIAYANALNAYQDYVDSVSQYIGLAYQAHCMTALETFTRTYTDKEYHRTLYYYDQAGNLVKTIPPEGVELLAITSYTDQLETDAQADRLNGTHTVLTTHRMETKYQYNSLNQLTRQVNPDQDKLDLWEITLPNGLYAGLNTTAIQLVSANRGYLTGYIQLSSGVKRGLLYRTDNGGANWTKVNNTVAAGLRRIAMADNSIGFAVGEAGIALQTTDGGMTWDMLNLYGIGITGELNDVLFTSSTYGRFVGEGDAITEITLTGSTAVPDGYSLDVPTAISGQTIVRINAIDYDGTDYLYAVTVSDGSHDYDAIFRETGSGVLLETVAGTDNKTVQYYSSTEGIVTGADGDIVRIHTPGSGTAFTQTLHKSGIAHTPKQVFFLNADRGIGLFAPTGGGGNEGYFTVNGGETWNALPGLDGLTYLSLTEQSSTYLELAAAGNTAATKRIYWNTTVLLPEVIEYTHLPSPQALDLVTATMVKDANGPTFLLAGADNGKLYFSNHFITGTETATYSEIGQLNGSNLSETAVKITAHRFGTGAVSGAIVSSEGTLYSLHRNAGSTTFSIAAISTGAGTPAFTDLVFDPTDVRIYAYDNTTGKLHKMTLSATTAVSSTTAFSTAATASGITAIGFNSGRITIAGTGGAITTTNAVNSTNTLSTWSDRSSLELTPVNDLQVIPGGTDAAAAGENGLVLYSTTSGTWNIKAMQATDDLYAIRTAGSVEIVVGANGFAQQMTSTPTHAPLMSTNGMTITALLPDVDLHDVATDGTNTYLAGTNGTVLFSADPSTTAFSSTTGVYPTDFYAAAIPGGQSGTPRAITAGAHAMIYKFLVTNGTQQKGVFSSELTDVHFADLNTGTLLGKHFFVRQSFDGGETWNIVLPGSSASTQFAATINKVWTLPSGFALMGGVNYLASIEDGSSSPHSPGLVTINDIQFRRDTPLNGYCALNDGTLLRITLTPSGGTYTVSTSASAAVSGANWKAIHVFDNGTNVMAVGTGNTVERYNATSDSWTDLSPTTVTGQTFNDVYFHDDMTGYIVSDTVILRTKDAAIDATDHHITSIDYEVKSVYDRIVDSADQVAIKCIAFGSRYNGVWGGSYTAGITAGDQHHTAYVRQVHDESGEFSARFFYDRLGRIVVSQNARQYDAGQYSYSLYDGLGRVYEAGVKTENGSGPQFAGIFGTTIGGQYVPSVIDDARLADWLGEDSTNTRTEVTRSYYDATTITGLPAGFTPDPLTQRKRIAHVTYEAVYDGNDQTYDHGTHYDYDIHGNVKTLIQDNQLMASLDANIADQRFKRMDYNYDLVSGNVHRVDYETGNADQWHHAYTYDADNRITQAFTTTTTPLMESDLGQTALQNEAGMTPYWDKEAAYRYYKHGPLARTELGQQKVQGLDYVYTVQGWLKGVNSNTLQADRDPGQDNGIGSGNAIVAGDVYGYSLHYFDGDYASIGGSTFAADQTGSDLLSNSSDLYNGNIARMITTITNPDTREVLPLGNAYRYDQLNRIIRSNSYANADLSDNSWGSGGAVLYGNGFRYDANGNILGQLRYDGTGAPIDSLTYRYHTNGTGSRISNRLYHVNDSVGSGDHADDIDDMGTYDNANFNSGNNYIYDKEGRLIHDEQEGIDAMQWRVDGKVSEIIRPGASEKKNLRFDYDAMGHRIAKHVLTSAGALEHSTYYILDASGNVMSVYERDVDDEAESVAFAQTEKHIYGSSRLGILKDSIPLLGTENDTINAMLTKHVIGKRSYELSNHLGNVLSTVSDIITTRVVNDTVIAPTITGHGISVSGDMVTRTLTPDNLWNAGGVSAQTVNEGDTLIWTLGGPSYLDNRFVMCGLSYDSPDDDYASIDYCWYTYGTAGLYIYEGGGSPGEFGGFDTGHILKIARVGGNIEYYHNGALIRTTTDAHPDQPMIVDFSMYEATRYIYQLRIAKKAVVYSAQIRSSQDYSPFGVTLEGRSFTLAGAERDRYGFQGQEADDEVKGEGNSYNFEYRMNDPRLGRFFAVDPLAAKYPWYTPYQFGGNKPIAFIELEGLEEHTATTVGGQELTLSGPYSSSYIEDWAESNNATVSHSDNPDVKTNVTFFASGAGHDRDNTGYIDATIRDLRISGISNPTDINAHGSNFEDVKFTNGVFSTTPYYDTQFPENIDWRIEEASEQIETYLSSHNTNQVNLFGYSAGSVIFAQSALYLATEKDVKIDNLILLGTTIDSDSELMNALTSNPNIGEVWTVDIIGDNVRNGVGAAPSFIDEGDSHPHFKFAFWPDAHERRMELFQQFVTDVGLE